MSGLGPFADAMGVITRADSGAGEPLLVLPFADIVEGRPGFLHGGAIASLLEAAALAAIRARLPVNAPMPRTVTMSVDYLRGGERGDTFARGSVTRRGRRIAHVTASAWQDDPTRPIALLRMNLVLDPGGR